MDRTEAQLKSNNSDHLFNTMNEINDTQINSALAEKIKHSGKNTTLPDHLDFSSPFDIHNKSGKSGEGSRDRQASQEANHHETHHHPERSDSDESPARADKPQHLNKR